MTAGILLVCPGSFTNPVLSPPLQLIVSVWGGVVTSVCFKSSWVGTSLVAQWLRIRLPMQGTQVRALVEEDPTCRGATKPASHNY